MKKQILLIDDDFDEAIFLNTALNGAGLEYHCAWANGVAKAVQMLNQLDPEIILVDLNMPLVDGIAGIQAIRAMERMANVPVVLFSTFISERIRKKAMQSGATFCVQKPATLHELERLLKNFLHPTGRIDSGDVPSRKRIRIQYLYNLRIVVSAFFAMAR